jgi:sugar/nucleoside kinase (ribokinase family)
MRVVALGDLLMDVVVLLEAPLVHGDDTRARSRIGAGGQAANVAAWAASLGAQARFVGKRGADPAGALLEHELAASGATVSGPRAGRSGVVVSLSGDGERSMASDRGSAPELESGELDPAWFDCDRLYVSGYALAVEPLASAALRAAELARACAAQVAVDLSAVELIDEPFRARVRRLEPELVFATELEQERFGALEARWLVKRGARGVSFDGAEHAALPTELADTTGAGDALAAGVLVGGLALGLEAAARCCARLGSMP